MIALAVLAFLIGAILSVRWRAFVLLPTSGSIAAVAIALGLMSDAGLAATMSHVVLTLFAHQSGYLCGALISGYFTHRVRDNFVARARI